MSKPTPNTYDNRVLLATTIAYGLPPENYPQFIDKLNKEWATDNASFQETWAAWEEEIRFLGEMQEEEED